MSRGFGVAAGLDPEIAGPLASTLRRPRLPLDLVERPPGRRAVSKPWRRSPTGADAIDLGVAVIALDRHGPEAIAEKIAELGLPRERLWIGVGAGFSAKPLTAMREALPQLRDALGDVRLVLAAMGPKMCALRRRRVRRRVLQLDDARLRRRGTRARRARAPARPAARRRPCSATSAPPSATTPSGAWPRRRASTATCTTATATTSPGSASRRGPSASRRRTRAKRRRQLDAYEALDVPVVRGLASANLDAMAALAEAAASRDERLARSGAAAIAASRC